MFITYCPTVTLQLHNFDLFRACRTSSFCTVAWQLAKFQLTWRIARSLGDSWASCFIMWCAFVTSDKYYIIHTSLGHLAATKVVAMPQWHDRRRRSRAAQRSATSSWFHDNDDNDDCVEKKWRRSLYLSHILYRWTIQLGVAAVLVSNNIPGM